MPGRFAPGCSRPRIASVSNRPKPTALPVTATRTAWMMSPTSMPSACDELVQQLFQRRRRRTARPPPVARGTCASSADRLGWLADPLVERRFVVRQSRRRRRRSRRSPRMSPATLIRSPAACDDPRQLRADVARRRRRRRSPARCKIRQHRGHLLLQRQLLHVAVLERPQLLRIEAGRRLVHALQREVVDHLLRA